MGSFCRPEIKVSRSICLERMADQDKRSVPFVWSFAQKNGSKTYVNLSRWRFIQPRISFRSVIIGAFLHFLQFARSDHFCCVWTDASNSNTHTYTHSYTQTHTTTHTHTYTHTIIMSACNACWGSDTLKQIYSRFLQTNAMSMGLCQSKRDLLFFCRSLKSSIHLLVFVFSFNLSH